MNEKYLIEKVKVSDVPTPPKYFYKIPSKTGHSEYYRKFGYTRAQSLQDCKLKRDNTGSVLKLPNEPITGYKSIYHMEFAKKAGEAPRRLGRAKYEKSEAPVFNETSYHRDFTSVGPSPTASAKRV